MPHYCAFAFLLGLASLHAQGNPFTGYAGYTDFYSLSYSDGSGFGPGNSGDVYVKINIGGTASGATISDGVTIDSIILDTGSRGLFVSADTLGSYGNPNANSFSGTIDLTSSKRVYSGTYTPTPVNFSVTDKNNLPTVVTANIPVLNVLTLGSQSGGTATYGARTQSGTLHLVGGGTLHFAGGSFSLSNGQAVSYADNPGLLPSVSNFGVGFFVGGNSTTGPIGNNLNQIYNAFLNLTEMSNGSVMPGYIIKENGVQLGLAANTTGFAYTNLEPTGLTSTNSVPDWKPSRGEIVANGETNGPGEFILDTGIGYAEVGLTDPNGWQEGQTNALSINLLNSNGAVGYHFGVKEDETTDPTLAGPDLAKKYVSQTTFYNSGRNIFNAFDMVYDGQNGYLGLKPNQYGATDDDVYFQAGFYPVPEPTGVGLLVVGTAFLWAVSLRIRRKG